MTDILSLPNWAVLGAERNDDKLVIKAEHQIQPVTGMHSEMRMASRCVSFIQDRFFGYTFTDLAQQIGCDKTVRTIANEYVDMLNKAYKPTMVDKFHVVRMLNEECDLSFERDEVAIENKKIKVRRYRELVDIQDKPFLPYIDRTPVAHLIEE